jgi:hypothetical protein
MRHPFPEVFMAQKQADVQREIEHNNLVREAKNANPPLQGWVATRMHDLSVWMMCTGERLHKHYHSQLPHLHQGSTQAR